MSKQSLIWLLIILGPLPQTTESMYAAALPNLASSLGVRGSISQLSFTIYYLGFASGIFVLGRISDLYGRRPVVIFGLILFTMTCFLSSLAKSIEIIMVLRFFQAFGASIASVVGQAISRDTFVGMSLSRLITTIAIANAFIPSIGASLGGYLVQYYNWTLVLRASAILGLALVIIMYFKLSETNVHKQVARNNKFSKVFKVVISDKLVLLNAFIVGAYSGILFGFYAEAPFFFMRHIYLEPATYGKCVLLLALSGCMGSYFCRKLIQAELMPNSKIILIGLYISLISCSLLVVISSCGGILYGDNKILAVIYIFLPIMGQIFGHNLVMPLILRHALEDYAKVTGTAGSIFGALYYILISLVILAVSICHRFGFATVMQLFLMLSILTFFVYRLILKLQNFKKLNEFS